MKFFKNLIRWACVTEAGVDDTSKFHVQKVKYLGKNADTVMVFPYGLHGNVPPDSLAMIFSVQGNPENRAAIAWTPKDRPQLASGEVAFYHPPTDAFMIWRANGDLDIETGNGGGANVNITCTEANITASTSMTFTTPTATFTGDLTVDGDLTVSGSSTLSSTVTSGGTDISDTHAHTGSPSAPTGVVSNTGAPV